MKPFAASALVFLAILASSAAHADGDPVAGKRIFSRCMACHDATTGRDRIGPTLVGVMGRQAGTLESYLAKYSASMREAGASGLVWDDANLAAYLRDTDAVIPNGKMVFPGLKKDDDIANVIAYLKADPKP